MGIKRTIAICSLILPISLFGGLEQIRERIVRHQLDNGLTLIIFPTGDAPIFSAVTYVRVGAADEEEGFFGIGHIVEHMAFRGTKTIGSKDIERELYFIAKEDSLFNLILMEPDADSVRIAVLEKEFNAMQDSAKKYGDINRFLEIYERAGGVNLNASISYDWTRYFSNFPSNKLELFMSIESDRFLSPVLRDFYTDTRGVIAEERGMVIDTPNRKLIEEFLLTAFPDGHPYRHPIIGWTEDIMTATREEASLFFEKYYIPQNFIVALVGDVDPEEAIRLAEIYFGRLPKRPPQPLRSVPEVEQGERRLEIPMSAQPMLVVGYHRPDTKHPDDIIYDIIADYLGRGRTSLLHQSLVKERKIAIHVGCSPSFPGERFPSLFLTMIIPSAGHTAKESEKALYEVIEDLKKYSIPEEELTKIKARTKADIIKAFERDQSAAFYLAWVEGIYGDYNYLFTYLDRLAEVTPSCVQRVARKTFVKENRVVGSIIREEEK